MCRVPVALSLCQWGLSFMRSKSVFITSVKAAVLTPSPKPQWRAAASALSQPGDNVCKGSPCTAWCTGSVDRVASEMWSHAIWSQAPGVIWSQLFWVLNYGLLGCEGTGSDVMFCIDASEFHYAGNIYKIFLRSENVSFLFKQCLHGKNLIC